MELAGAQDIIWTLDDLVQELIMALQGYTGDIFVDSSSCDHPSYTEVQHPNNCTVSIAPDVVLDPNVSREGLLRLLQLSFHYKQIKRFMQQEQYPAVGRRSAYRMALCSGLEEVLCLYEDELVVLQDRLLDEEDGLIRMGLAGITYELHDLQHLLAHLHHMVYQLRRRSPLTLNTNSSAGDTSSGASDGPSGYATTYPGLAALDAGGSLAPGGLVVLGEHCGARLLHWLHDRKGHGEQLLRTVTQRLMWHVHQVFFSQLEHWMVHGQLINGGDEFLIQPSADAAVKSAEGQQAADTDAVRDTSCAGMRSAVVSGDAMDVAVMTEADTYRDFHSAFVVDNLQLPPGLSPHSATSIEFVGRAVRLLKSAPASAKLRELQDSWGSYNQHLLGQQEGLGCVPSMPQQLLPYGDAMAYAAGLRMLQEQSKFNAGALERIVEAIRADVASRVWQLVVVDSRLVDHLAGLKDYLLLAKGDFYQSFLTDAATLLAKPAGQVATKDIAVPWQSAAGKSTAACDASFRLFSLRIDQEAARQDQASLERAAGATPRPGSSSSRAPVAAADDLRAARSWLEGGVPQVADCLRLDAQLPWPLGVLITPRHLEAYNSLFALLLKVKRVQLDLEAAWQDLGRLCGRTGADTQPQDVGDLLQLRLLMGHLICNLQLYLQQDVIESNYDCLLQQVEAAQDFAEVAAAHESFVSTLKTQSLQHSSQMVLHMHLLFAVAQRLARLVKGARERGLDWDQVQDVKEQFRRVAKQLCIAMRSKYLQSQDRAPYLHQLHERLDFNSFLTKDLNITRG